MMLVPLVAAVLFLPAGENDWPSFRGANAAGTAAAAPLKWNVGEGKTEGVLWRTSVPGLGHSAPVIWGNRVYVTSAISGRGDNSLKIGLYGNIDAVNDDSEHRWMVYCLDRRTGRKLWEAEAKRGVPQIKRHTKATHANSTPATDGKHVVAFFGAEGLYCYDTDGRLKWNRDFGRLDSGFFMVPSAQWGFGSSPVIHKGRVLVQCDVQSDSFLAALDVETGREIWRTPRPEKPTWCTPSVAAVGGRDIVVCNGWKEIAAYDFQTGARIWRMDGGGDIPVPTPVIAHGMAFLTAAHGRLSPIYAVRLDSKGDISLKEGELSSSGVAWAKLREGAYMITPLVIGDYLYVLRDSGLLACYEARTGRQLYNERLGTGRTAFTASPVAAGGLIYCTSEEGETFVVKAGPEFSIVQRNSIGEPCLASPALSNGALFFRTSGHVVAVK
jgi:outer membrane protein assembly factor BamB